MKVFSESFCWAAVKWTAAALGTLMLAVMCAAVALAADRAPLPPTYLSAIATYDKDGRFVALNSGTTRYLSCREALEDARLSLEKAIEYQPNGAHSEGLCIPLHTYASTDLVRQ